MSFFRVATLFVICGIALSALGTSGTPQKSATKEAAQPDDIPKTIAESISGTLQFAVGNFIGLVEAMPEEKYSYIPKVGKVDGVRSFGEQVKHVACASFAFFNEFEGKKPPAETRTEPARWTLVHSSQLNRESPSRDDSLTIP